ncbi:MAG: LytTR family DNA-binding domain-containing protein [Cellulophaga sp.]
MRCIIIEDEIPAQKVLQHYISRIANVTLLGTFQSALDANAFLSKNEIDLIFLDINLPDISGVNYIKTLTNPPIVIMTTAYHEYAVESFELDAVLDYIIKPFSFARFLKAINRAETNFTSSSKTPTVFSSKTTENKNDTIFLNIDKTLHKLKIDEILYIESDKNYVTVVTQNSKLVYLDSLKNWLLKLPETDFVQVHKSYIINCSTIEKIAGNTLFIQQTKIPIGRTYKLAFLKKLNL